MTGKRVTLMWGDGGSKLGLEQGNEEGSEAVKMAVKGLAGLTASSAANTENNDFSFRTPCRPCRPGTRLPFRDYQNLSRHPMTTLPFQLHLVR